MTDEILDVNTEFYGFTNGDVETTKQCCHTIVSNNLHNCSNEQPAAKSMRPKRKAAPKRRAAPKDLKEPSAKKKLRREEG